MIKVVSKPWGSELWWAHVPGCYAGKLLRISAGHRLSLQYHERKDESLTLISGSVRIDIGTSTGTLETIDLLVGEGLHIPPGTIHRIAAVTDSVLAEVSTDHLGDVVRIEDDYAR